MKYGLKTDAEDNHEDDQQQESREAGRKRNAVPRLGCRCVESLQDGQRAFIVVLVDDANANRQEREGGAAFVTCDDGDVFALKC